ncbi:hypothetical protein [Streptomyces luteireticuli]|uniref:hypothetical protein n=1 Tax=Streptomyces luteireticuli TaxID=173858 RepID=UPI0035591E88
MRSIAATTDGWRGLPGPAWAEPHLLAALDHCATQQALGNSVLIGYDGRAGARELAHLAADLLTTRGITCHLATSPAPTPALGHLVHTRTDLSAAVIVTASHNPPGYIGIKLRNHTGHGIQWPQPSEQRWVDPGQLPHHDHPAIDALAPYAGSVGAGLCAAADRFDGDVLLDAAHGAVGALAPHLPALTVVRARPLPFFAGHTPDPVPRTHAKTTARALLSRARHPHRTLLALTDGDGDRLVLFTHRSGYIGSPEQAAALLHSGLPVERLITTLVAPRMAVRAAEYARPGLRVTETPVGFKHIVAAWHTDPAPALGLEPNGALVHARNANDYFERDSLAALAFLLRAFPTLAELDDAVTEVRTRYPHAQLVHTTPVPLPDVLTALPQFLPGWNSELSQELAIYDDGAHGRIAVRASGTEPGTRLYIEAPLPVAEQITTALGAVTPSA